jgi:L-ascorbate metabolism protein UlaG (beta-lactamase superfamily)
MSVKELFSTPLAENEVSILFFGYSGVIVRTSTEALAFDLADLIGFRDIQDIERLNAILYTHSHYDHYHSRTAEHLFKRTNAPLIIDRSMYNDVLKFAPKEKVYVADPNKQITIGEIVVSPVKGRHVGPITLYHVKLKHFSMFHGADSAYIPLKKLIAELALLPTGEPSPTASPEDAFEMVKDLKPKVVAVFHGSEYQHDKLRENIMKNMPQTQFITLEKRKIFKFTI